MAAVATCIPPHPKSHVTCTRSLPPFSHQPTFLPSHYILQPTSSPHTLQIFPIFYTPQSLAPVPSHPLTPLSIFTPFPHVLLPLSLCSHHHHHVLAKQSQLIITTASAACPATAIITPMVAMPPLPGLPSRPTLPPQPAPLPPMPPLVKIRSVTGGRDGRDAGNECVADGSGSASSGGSSNRASSGDSCDGRRW